MMQLHLLLYLATGFQVPTAAAGQTDLATRVNSWISPHVTNHDFAGVILIARGDSILLHQGYGLANADLGVPHQPDTRFRIASLSKTFTAAAVVMLIESGQLRYQDRLAKFIPDFPRGNEITVQHLLLHQSGVQNPDYRRFAHHRATLEDVIADIKSKPVHFDPGSRSQYSNAGYVILAAIIEQVSGMTYEEFLRQRIFVPLGMIHTDHDDPRDVTPGRSALYLPGPEPSGVTPIPETFTTALTGSGSIVTTAGDLYLWAKAIHHQTLFRREGLPWPFGWGRDSTLGKTGLEQTGMNNGYFAALRVYFDGTYIVCLSNIQSAVFTECGPALTRLVEGETVELPADLPSLPGPDRPDRFAGRYLTQNLPMIDLYVRDGKLYLAWDGDEIGAYLSPLGNGKYRDRLYGGTLEFALEDGKISQFTYHSGNSPFIFRRQ